jgi:fatty acid desaturase
MAESGASIMSSAEEMSDELFSKLNKTTLINKSGTTYKELRKGLNARWPIVWRDVALGWLSFGLTILATIVVSHRSLALALVAAAVGAVLIGFTIAYLNLFQHEAAHYNIHPDKWWNDLLCNVFVSGIVGTDVRSYRLIHWDHHRYFGGSMDSEISYRHRLNLNFLGESLFGVRALKVVLMRGKKLRSVDTEQPTETRAKTGIYTLLGGMVFNAGCLGGLCDLHEWAAVFSWICGVLVFFPFFVALRQLLEHRGELRAGDTGAEVTCFATNRLFGDGMLASTLGGAGFNRHLLHHWDPQISYTRLRELENFLLETQIGPYLRGRQTTYWRTFEHLFSSFGKDFLC